MAFSNGGNSKNREVSEEFPVVIVAIIGAGGVGLLAIFLKKRGKRIFT